MHESRSVERLSPFRDSVSRRPLPARGSSRGSNLRVRAPEIPRSSDKLGRPRAMARERTRGMDADPDLMSADHGEGLLTASQLARRISVSRNCVYQAVE